MKWRNLLSPFKVWQALRIEASAAWLIARHGTPNVILHFLGGLGDELLLTCLAHELKERSPTLRIWQISHAAELLYGNPDYAMVLGKEFWALRHSNLLEHWRVRLHYAQMVVPGRRDLPSDEHILAIMCRQAGLRGRVRLRPRCHLSEPERSAGRLASRQIAIQSVGQHTHETWMLNKTWFHERFQQVVDGVRRRWPDITVIQLGVPGDPPLENVLDLRGRTSLRQTAAIISQCECLVGTEGLLAHLARAVDCRSVVIFGGRTLPKETGYACNENLVSQLPCAPCGLWQDCDYDRQCMRMIQASNVIDAVDRALAKRDSPLELDEIDLGPQLDPLPRADVLRETTGGCSG
jgi:hypothetical protein